MALLPLAWALASALLAAEPPAAGGAFVGLGPASQAPQTVDCSRDDEAQASRDCAQLISQVFDQLKPFSGVQNARFLYLPKQYGASTNCDDNGTAFDSMSPAASDDCGGQTVPFVVAGYSIWSMASACVPPGAADKTYHLASGIAFVLAHELSHLANHDPQSHRDDIKRVCEPWTRQYIASGDADKLLDPVVNQMKAEGKPSAQIRRTVIERLLEQCIDQNQGQLNGDWQPHESDADSNAMTLIANYNSGHKVAPGDPLPKISMDAGTCAMKGLRDLEWATAPPNVPKDPNRVSDHPDTLQRVAKLSQIADELCRNGPPTDFCDADQKLAATKPQ